MRLAGRARGFDDIGIDRALGEEFTPVSLCASSSNTSTNIRTDDLALLFRIADACQGSEEALLGVDADHPHAQVFGESAHHLVALPQPQQAMVDENAHQLITNRSMQQGSDNRRVDTTGQPSKTLPLPTWARTRSMAS